MNNGNNYWKWIAGAIAAVFLSIVSGLYRDFTQLDTSHFMPHGICLSWKLSILILNAASNSAIALSYAIIPAQLIRAYLQHKSFAMTLPMFWKHKLAIWFAAFILLCGATHVMDIIILWQPYYYLDVLIRGACGLASIGTVIALHFTLRSSEFEALLKRVEELKREGH